MTPLATPRIVSPTFLAFRVQRFHFMPSLIAFLLLMAVSVCRADDGSAQFEKSSNYGRVCEPEIKSVV